MSNDSKKTAEPVKLNFTDITEDDCKAFLMEKVKNHYCPCCSTNAWSILSSPNNNFGLLALSKDGGFSIPPPHLPILGLACNSCGYIRQHALGLVAQWKAAKKATP